MTRNKRSSRDSLSEWEAQIQALDTPRKEPLTPARIVEASLGLIRSTGFDQLTMRAVAQELGVSPGALYVHVRDKAELGDLMLGELCSRVSLPAPDAKQWRRQVADVCGQLLGEYLSYPGIGYAVFASAPTNLEALRITEGLLQILTDAGAEVRAAAWAIDSALTFTAAFAVMSLRRTEGPDGFDRAELVARYRMLPADRFPVTVNAAEAITEGTLNDRYATAIDRLFSGLATSEEQDEA